MTSRVRVLIVDDQVLVRQGLKALLSLCPHVEIAGEAWDGEEAVRLVAICRPDVVLMDVRMPGMSGLEATHAIKSRWPEVRVVIVTMYPASRTELFADEADAFLLKGFRVTELRDAVFGASGPSPSTPSGGGGGQRH